MDKEYDNKKEKRQKPNRIPFLPALETAPDALPMMIRLVEVELPNEFWVLEIGQDPMSTPKSPSQSTSYWKDLGIVMNLVSGRPCKLADHQRSGVVGVEYLLGKENKREIVLEEKNWR